MLTRSSQIGEFYVMQPPQVEPPNSGKFTCDMLLYDEESDRHVRITWLDALKASGAGEIIASNGAAANTDALALAGPPAGANSLFAWWIDALKWAAYSADQTLYTDSNGKITTVAPSSGAPTALPTINSSGALQPGRIRSGNGEGIFDITRVNCRIVVARPFSAPPPVSARTPLRRSHALRASQSSTSCTR